MNPDTLHAVAEIITATTALSPYVNQLITLFGKAINTLRSKTTKPRARHRQGEGRHTK